VVTSGNWTGRFYSSRKEGERTFGLFASGNEAAGARAKLRIPYRPEGREATITAKGSGVEAKITIKLPADPAAVAREAEVMAKFEQLHQQTLAAAMAKAESLDQRLTEARAALNRRIAADPARGLVFGTTQQARLQVTTVENELNYVRKVSIPFSSADAYTAVRGTMTTSDPEWDLRMLLQRARLEEAVDACQLEEARSMVKLVQDAMADPEQQRDLPKLQNDLKLAQERVAKFEARPSNGDYNRVLRKRPAELTGNLALVREACDLGLLDVDARVKDGHLSASMAKQEKAKYLRSKAEAVVMFSGDRAEAARIWQQIDQLMEIKDDPKRRDLPAWLPEKYGAP
jgi:hypothetical protein